MTKNLAEGIRDEIRRCRELREQYTAIGAPGVFGAAMIEQSIRKAEDAQAEGDLIAMMRAYEMLRGHTG